MARNRARPQARAKECTATMRRSATQPPSRVAIGGCVAHRSGGRGIRTPKSFRTAVFKTAAIAILPALRGTAAHCFSLSGQLAGREDGDTETRCPIVPMPHPATTNPSHEGHHETQAVAKQQMPEVSVDADMPAHARPSRHARRSQRSSGTARARDLARCESCEPPVRPPEAAATLTPANAAR